MKTRLIGRFLLWFWIGAGSGFGFTETSGEAERAAIRALQAQIAHHDELYFKKAAPEISDYDYDQLKRRLSDLQKASGDLKDGDASLSLGDDRTEGFVHAPHREPMLGLEKSYTEEELKTFTRKLIARFPKTAVSFVIEPKFDGLAISVVYEKGKLVRAVTRGNGVEGDDVTAHVLARGDLPVTLRPDPAAPVPEFVELRGEVYMTWAEFNRINGERESAGEAPFAHPRNLAAGTLKHQGELPEARHLDIVFYGVGACEPKGLRARTQSEAYEQLRRWGLPAIDHVQVAATDDGVWRAVQALEQKQRKLPYPVDGAVVKLNDVSKQDELGAGRASPHWAMAYKFAPRRMLTELRAITLQIGRTGVLTPVAELAPVQLGGATISRASLHNRAEIERRDYRIGDSVYVEKAGEIIPVLAGVDLLKRKADALPFVFPENCPACGTKLTSEIAESAVRCPNPSCPPQVVRRIEHFASRNAVGIAGLGPAMAHKLVEAGFVKNIADLYALTRRDLMTLPGVGEKTADRLLASIQKSRRAELWRIIHGLGIPGVGTATAQELADKAQSLSALAAMSADALRAGGVSERTAQEVAGFFQQQDNRRIVLALK